MWKRSLFLPMLAGLSALAVGAAAIQVAAGHGLPGAHAATTRTTLAAGKADVLAYLRGISGNHIVSGAQNGTIDPSEWTAKAHDITGRYPGLWSSDFLFEAPAIAARQRMVDQAKLEWSHGALVSLSYHACPPTMSEPCDWTRDITRPLSDSQWNDVVTDGTALNRAWKTRLDTIAPYLQQLEDAGVPVLFRPVHEINEGWSWWGGRPGANGSRKLFQITHDYLTTTKGLANLLWVWSVKDVAGGASALPSYWPGDSYVDVAGLDAWVNKFPTNEYYQAMLSLAGSRPIALSEVGSTPQPAQLAGQPRWAYFMVWASWLTDPAWNTDDSIKATYYDPRVLTLDEMRIGGGSPTTPPTSGNLALGRPARASSTDGTDHPAANAFDGDTTTRWSSAYADQQWIYVDLGSAQQISRVQLRWETAYARGFQIQTSTDEQTWTTVYANYDATGGDTTVTFAPTSARWVKMYAFTRATEWGYSLWEFGVHPS